MLVKFTQSVASVAWSYAPGEIRELEDEVALGYIRSGAAIPWRTDQEETAALASPPAPERARPRRRGPEESP